MGMIVLGVACLALAIFDLKLLGDLSVQRAINETYASGGTATPSAGVEIETIESPAATTSLVPLPGAVAEPAEVRGAGNARTRAEDAGFLRMYADPRLRQQLIAERGLDRRKMLRGADRTLGIDADRWIMLSDRLAGAEVEARARRLRCAADPACLGGASEVEVLRQADDIAREVLGRTKAQELDAYRQTLNERHAVETLQTRLRDASLPPQRAEELIRALSDEGARIEREWADRGVVRVSPGISWTDLGSVALPSSATTPEQRYAAAADYSRRMRERAAPMLTAEQRAVFDSMQDDLLKRFERLERRRDRGG